MIRNVFLYGQLEELYGRGPVALNADNMAQLMSGLNSNLPQFRKNFNKMQEFFVVKSVTGDYKAMEAEEMGMQMGNIEEIHFIPNIEGSGVEIAIALFGMTAGAISTIIVGAIINIGIGLLVGAIAAALAPSPTSSGGTGRDKDHQSFLFSGPMNVVEQGGPVPLVYGEFRTGSTVISVGVTSAMNTSGNAIPGTPPADPPPPGGGPNPPPGSHANTWSGTHAWGNSVPVLTVNDTGGMSDDKWLVFSVTVPLSDSIRNIRVTGAEWPVGPASRHLTLSRYPGDFREADPAGIDGPFVRSHGTTVSVTAAVDDELIRGQTYYVNVRSWSIDLQQYVVGTANMIIQFDWLHDAPIY